MNSWIVGMITMWAIYSWLTIYGMLKYPLFTKSEKYKALVMVLLVPFFGAYHVNHDMGYRLTEESKQDLAYELPWWASIGMRSINYDDD
jgi:hypothetical protein